MLAQACFSIAIELAEGDVHEVSVADAAPRKSPATAAETRVDLCFFMREILDRERGRHAGLLVSRKEAERFLGSEVLA